MFNFAHGDWTHAEIISLVGLAVVMLSGIVTFLYQGGRFTKRVEGSIDRVAAEVAHFGAANTAEHAEIKEDLKEIKKSDSAMSVTIAAHTDRIGQIEGRLVGDAFARKHQKQAETDQS